MVRSLVSLVALSALLGGCSGAAQPGRSSTATRAQTSASAPRVAGPVHFIQTAQPSARRTPNALNGVLTLDAQGCLRAGEGGPVLVWPAEAGLDLTEPGVVRVFHPGGAAVRVGEAVRLAGAELPADAAPPLSRPLGPCQGTLLSVDGFAPRTS